MPSHYLNQCCNIVNWTLGNEIRWNFNRNSYIFIHYSAFENKAVILSRPQSVNWQSSCCSCLYEKNAMQNWLTPMHVPMYILIVYTPVMTVILRLKCLFGSKILATYIYMVTLNAFPLHMYMTQNTFFLHILIRSIAVERIIFHYNSTDSLGHRAYALGTYLMVALLWRGSYFKQAFNDEFIQPGVSATNAILG